MLQHLSASLDIVRRETFLRVYGRVAKSGERISLHCKDRVRRSRSTAHAQRAGDETFLTAIRDRPMVRLHLTDTETKAG